MIPYSLNICTVQFHLEYNALTSELFPPPLTVLVHQWIKTLDFIVELDISNKMSDYVNVEVIE